VPLNGRREPLSMPGSHSDIQAGLQAVRERIRIAAGSAGRNPEEIRLIAVSKTVSCADIQLAIDAGQHVFGESTVQESLTRNALMRNPANEWHFIGHLQTNKVRHIPGRFAWLHTLDSLKLARKLSGHAETVGVTVNSLLQVNVADDPNKFGVQTDAVFTFVDELLAAALGGIELRGLMTIGRFESSVDETRRAFARLRELRDACALRFGAGMFRELSMGMSGDFEIAIAEGSTMVRVGSAIFGDRPARHAAIPRQPG
jgi:pyridoxal phosphate enzyme (YggS family)